MSFDCDIYLVGLGVYELRQLTIETEEILRRVNVIYHVSEKHADLLSFGKNVYDLRVMYDTSWDGTDVYAQIAGHIIDAARETRPIAVAFDGNPMLFHDVGWKVASMGAEVGLRVEALAGVSCLDVLPLELGFDPGDLGMQTLESTAMVQYGLALNPYLSTLLLQIGHFGVAPGPVPPRRKEGAYRRLVDHLLRYFPPEHPAVFIQSASSAASGTVLLTSEIAKIDQDRDKIRAGMTLYLPRLRVPDIVDAKVYQDQYLRGNDP